MSKAIENTSLVTVVLINDATGVEFVEGRGADTKAAIDAAVTELGQIAGKTYSWAQEYAGYTKDEREGDWLFRVREGDDDPASGRIFVWEVTDE